MLAIIPQAAAELRFNLVVSWLKTSDLLLLVLAEAESGTIAAKITRVIAVSSTFVKAFFILSPLIFFGRKANGGAVLRGQRLM